MKCSGDMIGHVIGESTPSKSTILFSDMARSARAGLYVVAEADGECVLGIVERVVSGNPLLPDNVVDAREVEGLKSYPELGSKLYKKGRVRWLSLLEPLVMHGKLVSPRVPVDPLTEVYEAPSSILASVFAGDGRRWIPLGRLITDSKVVVGVDVNKLTRHMAILAITGGGKSNTVCVLAKRIVDGMGGTMVVFDLHGEYVDYARSNVIENARVVEPKIHPASLRLSELLRLMGISHARAPRQERIVREAWSKVMEIYKRGQLTSGDFLGVLISYVSREAKQAKGKEKDSAYGAWNRLEDVRERYGDVISSAAPTSLLEMIEPGKLNIFNLSGIDEQGVDAVVSHYLRRILEERKRAKVTGGSDGYPVPVLVVIEEAHVLIPKEESRLTKTWAARIAREGRKFGVGLILVSQRPKGLDANVLSQTNNKIILRVVEPTDQRYIQQASEQLSEDLLELLPELNPGEAVLLGSMVKIPALVKIDYCGASSGGADIDLVREWMAWKRKREELRSTLVSDLESMYEV